MTLTQRRNANRNAMAGAGWEPETELQRDLLQELANELREIHSEALPRLEDAILRAGDNSVVCISLQNMRELTHSIESISSGTDVNGIEDRLDDMTAALDQQTKAILQSAEIQAAATRENTKALLIFAKAIIEGRK